MGRNYSWDAESIIIFWESSNLEEIKSKKFKIKEVKELEDFSFQFYTDYEECTLDIQIPIVCISVFEKKDNNSPIFCSPIIIKNNFDPKVIYLQYSDHFTEIDFDSIINYKSFKQNFHTFFMKIKNEFEKEIECSIKENLDNLIETLCEDSAFKDYYSFGDQENLIKELLDRSLNELLMQKLI